jgi:hypothetical protein
VLLVALHVSAGEQELAGFPYAKGQDPPIWRLLPRLLNY